MNLFKWRTSFQRCLSVIPISPVFSISDLSFLLSPSFDVLHYKPLTNSNAYGQWWLVEGLTGSISGLSLWMNDGVYFYDTATLCDFVVEWVSTGLPIIYQRKSGPSTSMTRYEFTDERWGHCSEWFGYPWIMPSLCKIFLDHTMSYERVGPAVHGLGLVLLRGNHCIHISRRRYHSRFPLEISLTLCKACARTQIQ